MFTVLFRALVVEGGSYPTEEMPPTYSATPAYRARNWLRAIERFVLSLLFPPLSLSLSLSLSIYIYIYIYIFIYICIFLIFLGTIREKSEYFKRQRCSKRFVFFKRIIPSYIRACFQFVTFIREYFVIDEVFGLDVTQRHMNRTLNEQKSYKVLDAL